MIVFAEVVDSELRWWDSCPSVRADKVDFQAWSFNQLPIRRDRVVKTIVNTLRHLAPLTHMRRRRAMSSHSCGHALKV